MNFLINAVFVHLKRGVYFTFPLPNTAFIGGRRLKEEGRYGVSLKEEEANFEFWKA